MKEQNYVVERMSKDELGIAIEWAAREGWNPGLYDLECFYQTDPNGFFVGKLDGKIIAVGSAVTYDEQFAFCGFYIVDEAYRGQGYGLTLTHERLAYIGARNAGLDGVMNMLDKYARLGYRMVYNNARYEGQMQSFEIKKHANIKPLSEVSFEDLSYYDRKHFPAPRDAFLNCWISQPGGAGLGFVDDGKLLGYGVLRPCQQGYKIGPLFADTPEIANELFLALTHHAQGQPFYLDIPENNPHAIKLVNQYDMNKVFETTRMYLKGQPEVLQDHIYGITTFELG